MKVHLPDDWFDTLRTLDSFKRLHNVIISTSIQPLGLVFLGTLGR